MKIFWNDCARGPTSEYAQEVDLDQAKLIWTDEVRGIEGNFLGLIDDQDRTIQFYYQGGIPKGVVDASHLRIVQVDFPQPDLEGSYCGRATIGDVLDLIERAFQVGADYRQFKNLKFESW